MSALILASGSPRRRELLNLHGYRFEVRPPNVDEIPDPGEGARDFALRMAREKAASVPVDTSVYVLAADTVVHQGERTLGKPVDADEAIGMLAELSGKWHQVTTGFCVRLGDLERAGVVTTRVRFRLLSPAAIAGYVASGEPLDKAGAYGIQGLGGALVTEIEGSYTNVVGLPLVEVFAALTGLGLPEPIEVPL